MGTTQTGLLPQKVVFPDESVNAYFHEVNNFLQNSYSVNTDHFDNYEFSLKKKDFTNQNAMSKKGYDYEVYWLDYFKDYLLTQINKKKGEWAQNLMDSIAKQLFIYENKYKSLFFYEEFRIETQPKCLKEFIKKQEEEINILEDDQEMIEMPQGNYSELNLTENFGGSFLSVHSNQFTEGDPGLYFYHSRTKVKEYIKVFKNQLYSNDHPINIILRNFSEIFCDYVAGKRKQLDDLLSQNSDNYMDQVKEEADKITKILQQFIAKVQITIKLMYCSTINYDCFSQEKDEVINLITSHLFKNGRLYDCIFDLYQISMSETIKNLEYQLYELKDVSPEDLGIQNKFCLNHCTLDFQKRLINEKNNVIDGNAIKKEEITRMTISIDTKLQKTRETLNAFSNYKPKPLDKIKDVEIEEPMNTEADELKPNDTSRTDTKCKYLDTSIDHVKIVEEKPRITISGANAVRCKKKNRDSSIRNNSNALINALIAKPRAGKSIIQEVNDDEDDVIEIDMNDYAYSSAVRLLQTVKKYRQPFEKMMVMASLSAEVTDCISNFWKDLENIIPPSLLDLDADELMTIYIYIIIKSQLSELAIHSQIVNNFTTKVTQGTTIGYYFTTLHGAMSLIGTNSKDELIRKEQIKMARLSKFDPFS